MSGNWAGRLALLIRHWGAYCLQPAERRAHAGDLYSWLATTFVRRPTPGDGIPWITYPAQRWLRSHLQPWMEVFEWGSGGSTLFLAARVRRVVSIEYDPEWHGRTERALKAAALPNAEVRCIPPVVAATPVRAVSSSDPRFSGMDFRRYASAIDECADGSLDLVMIDGRVRSECALRAMPKVRADGAVLLDNSERADAERALRVFEQHGWPALHFEGPGPNSVWPVFWRTTVLRRTPESRLPTPLSFVPASDTSED